MSRTIIITGASDGIGAAAARQLVADGHDVAIVGRSRDKTEAIAAQLDSPAFVADFEAKFAAEINRITRDPALAERYGKAGRQRCIDEFSWEKIAKETVAVYEKAIAFHQGR